MLNVCFYVLPETDNAIHLGFCMNTGMCIPGEHFSEKKKNPFFMEAPQTAALLFMLCKHQLQS